MKLASLNTPNSLGTSLSIIGGLILGDYTVQTGWFTPQTILYMSIVALTSFVQPSIELGFALKFNRILLLITTGLFGAWGFIAGLVFNLYPLIPINWKALKKVLFRTRKQIDKR